MAEYELRFEENVSGRFYVDEECISCTLCSESAPEFFRESSEGGYHIVFAQPQAEREVLQVLEAMEDCPVEAIGDVGFMSVV